MYTRFGSEEGLQRVLENTVGPAHGIIELRFLATFLPVHGLAAATVADFRSQHKTNLVSIFDVAFSRNSESVDVHEFGDPSAT